jgi:hypothetical protein
MELLPEHLFFDRFVRELPENIKSICREIIDCDNDDERFGVVIDNWDDITRYIEISGDLAEHLIIVNYSSDMDPLDLIPLLNNIQRELNKYNDIGKLIDEYRKFIDACN